MINDVQEASTSFKDLALSAPLLQAINDVGYETPTPIQSQTIPPLLEGRDLIGQAQTGTGKTAAFALPMLEKIDFKSRNVQGLVLAPTRELAIQVAEAVHTYSKHLGKVRVLPVYGGQSINRQIARLNKGVHIVVGTPGRIMDHLRRGTLSFDFLKMVVLDEADEMLRMGFIDDVDWILGQAPDELQIGLFSATMPRQIRRIADRYLNDPITIEVEHKTLTVPTTEQFYLNVSERNKLDALTRILEVEATEAVLIFARTKVGSAEVAQKLQARGYASEAMHGDMSQAHRESVINRLRNGLVEIVVATDVAARGLDVEHISHVINYDIPYDTESYVHRIGRTGRAGRTGKAILFVSSRQRRMMRDIERYTGQRLKGMKMPTLADVAARRIGQFKDEIKHIIEKEELDLYLSLVEQLAEEGGFDMGEIAAAAARLARGNKPLGAALQLEPEANNFASTEDGMVRLFVSIGRRNGVRPRDIVGAIANEAGIPGRAIGAIDIYDRFSFVDVPSRYKDNVLERMAHSTIRNEPVVMRVANPSGEKSDRRRYQRDGRRQSQRGRDNQYKRRG
ncbi:MAG: DEAD/DEAH box helicase [Ardenticatenaceae bacterium]